MVINATFNNISVIAWLSVLLVEYPEKNTDLPQVTDKLYHIKLYIVQFHELPPYFFYKNDGGITCLGFILT